MTAARAAATVRPVHATALIGREPEAGRILRAVEAGRHAPQSLLVVGDAGTGKTALLDLAAERAREIDTKTLVSQGCASAPTRTPEARYPVALEECYAVMTWMLEYSASLRLTSRRLAVAGDCAGATMATALTMMAKQRGGPRIRAQLLYYPMTDPHRQTYSRTQFANGYLLTREAMEGYWQQYTDDDRELGEPTASPLRATPTDLAGLPPAMVITAEADVIRDEGELYAQRLREAGVAVTAVRYLGTVHDFVSLNSMRDSPPAQAAISQGGDFLKRALADRP